MLGCDAMTVNPYGGKDAVEPFLEYSDKGVIVWCRSSNPSAVDFQDLMVDDDGSAARPFWQVGGAARRASGTTSTATSASSWARPTRSS